jgi:hypothetical protein
MMQTLAQEKAGAGRTHLTQASEEHRRICLFSPCFARKLCQVAPLVASGEICQVAPLVASREICQVAPLVDPRELCQVAPLLPLVKRFTPTCHRARGAWHPFANPHQH